MLLLGLGLWRNAKCLCSLQGMLHGLRDLCKRGLLLAVPMALAGLQNSGAHDL